MAVDVRAKIEDWRSRLLDLTKRNRLINCKVGARTALDLLHPTPEEAWRHLIVTNTPLTFAWKGNLVDDGAMSAAERKATNKQASSTPDLADDTEPVEQKISLEKCLASPRLRADHLLTSLTDDALSTRLKRLALNAQTSIDEQGVNILFIGFGLLEWFESPQSEIALISPLLLIPVRLARSDANSPWQLSAEEDEIVANQCLHEMLKADFRLDLPEFAADGSQEEPDPFQYLGQLRQLLDAHPFAKRWRLTPKVILGTFSFQKVAMWQDLKKNSGAVESHHLCRAIAGDLSVSPNLPPLDFPKPSDFDDRIHPKDVHSILDNDSSQMEAILAARHGVDLVIDGPPGTGKSQTIANTIAECLADGKTVLFVSEKSAALEVVKRRLDEQRLGDLCLECHSHKANKKDVVAELRRSLELPAESYRDQTKNLDQLRELRSKLNGYVRTIHRPQGNLGITPFEAHGRLASLFAAPATRCQLQDPLKTTDGDFRSISKLLDRFGGCQNVLEDLEGHPWRGATVSSFSFSLQDEIRDSFASLAELIDGATTNLATLQRHGLLDAKSNRQSVVSSLVLASDVLSFSTFPKAWLSENPAAVCQAIRELHDSEQELLRLTSIITEFDVTSKEPNVDSLSRIAQFIADPWLARLRTDRAVSIRGLTRVLETTRDALARIRREVDELNSEIDELSRHLTVRIAPESTIGVLHKLAQIGSIIGDMGPLKAAWFDNDVRAKLLQAATLCLGELAIINNIARAKADVWTSEAFQEIGKDVCLQANEFVTILDWLWGLIVGTWYPFSSRARILYRKLPPRDPRRLMEDMVKLREFHRRMATVQKEEGEWAECIVFDARGSTNWNVIHAGVDTIERLQAVIRIPDQLKAALCTEHAIDRCALQAAAQSINARLSAIEAQVKSLSTVYTLGNCAKNGGAYQNFSSRDFVTWLNQAEHAIGEFLAEVAEIERCLTPGHDLTLAEVSKSRLQLSRLREQRSLAAERRQTLSGLPGMTSEKIVGDDSKHLRSEDVEGMVRLQQFLAKYGDRPQPNFVEIVTSRENCLELSRTIDDLQNIFRVRMRPFWDTVAKVFPTNEAISTGITIDQMPLAECAAWLRAMIQSLPRFPEWIEFNEIKSELTEFGLHALIEEVVAGKLPIASIVPAFQARFYHSWLDKVYQHDPVLGRFRIDDHEATLATFRNLDRDFIRGAYKRIRVRLLQDADRPRVGGLTAPPSSEMGILLRESTKKRRQMPIRQLFRRIPTVLQRLKPCVMMSPLAVSTFLDSEQIKFDVVIFDEASQVRPFDAIGAIYRGKQLIVAGDQQQLPPTNFFDRMDSDDDVDFSAEESEDLENNLSDYESILDVCCSLEGIARKRLKWHYRSRRESLIAFSNHFFYGNELVTFPSVLDVDGCSAVRLHHVPEGRWRASKEGGYNPIEARETALLISQHYVAHPDRSLGVITFNQRQQTAVRDELEIICKARPELEARFNDSDSENLFIKNLETVQGDERDHIILSVGYGYDLAGKFAMRFGPLNQKGGERRLNVAITRARYEMILVSSVRAEDIDLARTQSQGAKLLRGYLDFAERGVEAIRAQIVDSGDEENDSPFEYEVEQALTRLGLSVRRQVGCSGFKIDLALKHPTRPGRYVLGIECDGRTYHSSATARDRDRLRQEVLEGLGWRICRVWSTDWVREPQRQIKRIMLAYEEELSRIDKGHSSDADPAVTHASPDVHEERPVLRIRDPQEGASGLGYYSNIDEVPEEVLRQAISELLRRFGQTSREELVKTVARQLGFQRTGRRIQERVGATINQMTQRGDLTKNGEGFLSVG